MKFNPLIPVNPEGLDEIARALLEEAPDTGGQLDITANINKADYIRIPETKILIAKQEIYKNKNWQDTHFALAENKLYMPTPSLFMPYFLNVIDAAQGKMTLYDGNNNPIPKQEAEDLYKYLATNYKDGCWTWLNAMFGEGVIKTVKSVDLANKKLIFEENPLEKCLMKDCFVNLKFNSQGLAVEKSQNQNYEQGKNIKFHYPRNGSVAVFGAIADGVDLDCYGYPAYSDARLGVFACAREE